LLGWHIVGVGNCPVIPIMQLAQNKPLFWGQVILLNIQAA
jgi:hypothetical protein